MIKKIKDSFLQVSDNFEQITLPDSRYYKNKKTNKYYPSVTYVLGYYPKGKHFEEWLKKVGYASEYIVKKASEEGTLVHEMAEEYLKGKEIKFLNDYGHPQYDISVWQMFLRFVDFWETYKPELLHTEVLLFSDELEVAGTCDLVCKINGELWVLDLKTSNNLQTTYDLQTAVYTQAYEENSGKKVDRRGILWLKSRSRGVDKSGKRMKGKNWEIYESPRSQEENLFIFSNVKALFDLENPTHKPSFTTFKTSAKLNVEP